MKRKLEVCVDSLESALIAQRGGADRLEVCANLVIGGTTPGVSLFQQMRKACQIDLNVLIRPRFGDFLYTDAEFESIAKDVELFQTLGADGVVVGCLKEDGSLDVSRMKELRKRAGDMHMTLHRAFDVCRDPYQALEEAVSLGLDTILTSGQEDCCMDGREVLKKLAAQAGERIEIMAGAGVNAEVIEELLTEIQTLSFHMSGKETLESGMTYRNARVHMGLPGMGEFFVFRTQEAQVRKAREVLDRQAYL